MKRKTSKAQYNSVKGCIGPSPAERSLEQILDEYASRRICARAMSRLNKFDSLIRAVVKAGFDRSKELYFLQLTLEDQNNHWKAQYDQGSVPENVYTHVLNIMRAKYRRGLRNDFKS